MRGLMRGRPIRRAAALPLGLLVFAPAAEGSPKLLPEASVHLEAARYEPTEPELQWTGWIGGGAGLLRVEQVTAYFTAEVESVLGHVRRPFEATQSNYHLEAGLHAPVGAFDCGVFFHHVSRHAVDREKPQAVDWNVLGLRAAGPLSRTVRVSAAVGHTTLASLVGYRWEVTAGWDVDLGHPAYVRGNLRLVTVERSEEFPRGDFLDATIEGGTRWRRGERVLETFAAFERRNDVFLLVPGARSRLVLGFRIRYATP